MCICTSCGAIVTPKGEKGDAGAAPVNIPVEVITSSPATLNAANAGTLILETGAAVFNLPSAPEAGTYYDIAVKTTGAYTINTTGSDVFIGALNSQKSTDVNIRYLANGGTRITMNGDTQGGLVGTAFKVNYIGSNNWMVTGFIQASGVQATPFS
jgi:hypothetical protein